MKLKQLLISTASIAALAVVPMSIVSCGNNNNNSVEGLPPAGDSNGSTPGGDSNNQQPTIQYIDVESRNDMVRHILTSHYIVTEFIRQATNKSFNETLTSIKWTNTLKSMEPDYNTMTTTNDGTYYYYNIRTLTFNYSGAKVLEYSYNDKSGKPVTNYISGNGSKTIFVDLHFRSTKDLSKA